MAMQISVPVSACGPTCRAPRSRVGSNAPPVVVSDVSVGAAARARGFPNATSSAMVTLAVGLLVLGTHALGVLAAAIIPVVAGSAIVDSRRLGDAPGAELAVADERRVRRGPAIEGHDADDLTRPDDRVFDDLAGQAAWVLEHVTLARVSAIFAKLDLPPGRREQQARPRRARVICAGRTA